MVYSPLCGNRNGKQKRLGSEHCRSAQFAAFFWLPNLFQSSWPVAKRGDCESRRAIAQTTTNKRQSRSGACTRRASSKRLTRKEINGVRSDRQEIPKSAREFPEGSKGVPGELESTSGGQETNTGLANQKYQLEGDLPIATIIM